MKILMMMPSHLTSDPKMSLAVDQICEPIVAQMIDLREGSRIIMSCVALCVDFHDASSAHAFCILLGKNGFTDTFS